MWRAIQPIVDVLSAEFHGRPNLRQIYAPIVSDSSEPGLAGVPLRCAGRTGTPVGQMSSCD